MTEPPDPPDHDDAASPDEEDRRSSPDSTASGEEASATAHEFGPTPATGASGGSDGGPLSGSVGAGHDAGTTPPGATDVEPAGDEAARPATRRERRQATTRARKRHRHHVVLLVAISVVTLLLLSAGAAAGFLYYENHRIHRYDIKHLAGVASSGPQKDVQNILLIGSTTRCGLVQQNPAFGLCSEGVDGVNSDVVMILHLDPDHHKAAILSIPRDTFVPNARHDGVNKIDAALGDPAGPSQLIAAITDDFGIPIQHYVELNFDSFQGVVNALGGVHMYFPTPLYDAESSLNIPSAGCLNLNGFQALAVVRARHLQYATATDVSEGLSHYAWPYDPQSDLSRIRRDHEFLRVLASAVAKRGLGNFFTDLGLINSLAGNLSVDNGFSTSDMASLVLEFHGLDPSQVPEYTLPVVVDGSPDQYFYNGGGYGDVVFPVQPEDAQVVAQFLGTTPHEDAEGQPLPSPGSFTVAVENGTGTYEAGSRAAYALTLEGFHVSSVTDTSEPATVTEASVLYGNPAQLDDALAVQQALNGLAVVGYDPGITGNGSGSGAGGSTAGGATTSGAGSTGSSSDTSTSIDVGTPLSGSSSADVVLVLGSNVDIVSPQANTPTSSDTTTTAAGAATTSTAGSTGSSTSSPSSSTTSTSTTIPAVLASNGDLAAPSSSTESLEPWDPRSCNIFGGPGP